jgi:hypothetical protein
LNLAVENAAPPLLDFLLEVACGQPPLAEVLFVALVPPPARRRPWLTAQDLIEALAEPSTRRLLRAALLAHLARDELAIEALEALDALGGPRIIGSFDELTDEALAAIELMRSALHAGPAPARDAVATSVHRLDDGGFIRWRPDGVTAFRLGTIRALAPGHARL